MQIFICAGIWAQFIPTNQPTIRPLIFHSIQICSSHLKFEIFRISTISKNHCAYLGSWILIFIWIWRQMKKNEKSNKEKNQICSHVFVYFSNLNNRSFFHFVCTILPNAPNWNNSISSEKWRTKNTDKKRRKWNSKQYIPHAVKSKNTKENSIHRMCPRWLSYKSSVRKNKNKIK